MTLCKPAKKITTSSPCRVFVCLQGHSVSRRLLELLGERHSAGWEKLEAAIEALCLFKQIYGSFASKVLVARLSLSFLLSFLSNWSSGGLLHASGPFAEWGHFVAETFQLAGFWPVWVFKNRAIRNFFENAQHTHAATLIGRSAPFWVESCKIKTSHVLENHFVAICSVIFVMLLWQLLAT